MVGFFGFDAALCMFVLGAVCFCISIVLCVMGFYTMNDDRRVYIDDYIVLERVKKLIELDEDNQIKIEKMMGKIDDN